MNIHDDTLIENYLKGDTEALQVLFVRYEQLIKNAIWKYVKDEYLAQDVFQDVTIKVITAMREGKYQQKNFQSWLIVVACNAAIDSYRRKKSQIVLEEIKDYNLPASPYEVDKKILRKELSADLYKALDLLEEKQRDVVILRSFGGLGFKKISEIMGDSINTSLGRWRYASRNLRKILTEKPPMINQFQ